jgi:hypothetical protein
MDLMLDIPTEIPGSTDKTSPEHLSWMLRTCMHEADNFPVDKTGRWIGYVHGVLAMARLLDPDVVRNRTREQFHAAYVATGQRIPATQERVVECYIT